MVLAEVGNRDAGPCEEFAPSLQTAWLLIDSNKNLPYCVLKISEFAKFGTD
jgi:hypothetical protein